MRPRESACLRVRLQVCECVKVRDYVCVCRYVRVRECRCVVVCACMCVPGQPKKVSFFVKRDSTLRFFALCRDTYKVSKSSRSDF